MYITIPGRVSQKLYILHYYFLKNIKFILDTLFNSTINLFNDNVYFFQFLFIGGIYFMLGVIFIFICLLDIRKNKTLY